MSAQESRHLSTNPLQPVRGTQDLLPPEQRRHRFVTDTARALAERYGYHEIATPIFEFTEVFARPIGETSDIVTKEMYSFADRGGDEVTLRPEYTAGIVRAVISNGLTQTLPLKLFASGPMFRRPGLAFDGRPAGAGGAARRRPPLDSQPRVPAWLSASPRAPGSRSTASC